MPSGPRLAGKTAGPEPDASLMSGALAGARGFEPRSSEVEAQCPVHWTTRPHYGGPDRTRTGIIHYGCLFRKQDRYGALVGAEGLEPS